MNLCGETLLAKNIFTCSLQFRLARCPTPSVRCRGVEQGNSLPAAVIVNYLIIPNTLHVSMQYISLPEIATLFIKVVNVLLLDCIMICAYELHLLRPQQTFLINLYLV